MRMSVVVALAAALCFGSASASAFGAPRTGCTTSVVSQDAWLTMEIYSEETGWPESPMERQTRQWEEKIIVSQFGFPNTAPIDQGARRIDGSVTVNVTTADPSILPLSRWRHGLVIQSSPFMLSVLPSEEAALDRVQIVARLSDGEIELPGILGYSYESDGMVRLEVRPTATDYGGFAYAVEYAHAIEVRALRADGTLLGVAAFDLSSARALVGEMFARLPILLEAYEFGTLIDEFDCREDVEL